MTIPSARIDCFMRQKILWFLSMSMLLLLFCKPKPPKVVLHNACSGYTTLRNISFPTPYTLARLDSLGLRDSLGERDGKAVCQLDTRIFIHPNDRVWLNSLRSIFPEPEVIDAGTRRIVHVYAGINGLAFDSVPFLRRILVLNGTGKPGLARDVAYRFSIRFGLAPLEPQDADSHTVKQTVLYCSPDDVPLAEKLTGYLGTGEVEVRTNLVDMVLVLGADMLNPTTKVKHSRGVSIVVKKSLFTLFVYKNGAMIEKYSLALGKNKGDKRKVGDNRTPLGNFTITSIEDSHDWEHDFADDTLGSIKGAYGPWFLRLSTLASETKSGKKWTGIAIHGTHDEASIGTRASEGCIRIRNEDVEELKKMVRVGTPVRIEE